MNRYLISVIALAVAPLSLASAEPTPAPESTPPANCQQMQQMHQGTMQQQMGGGAMGGSGQKMQHGEHTGMGAGQMNHGATGHGSMHSGTQDGQMMHHGDHASMGAGNHQGMMHGQGQCPAAGQPQDSQTDAGK